MSDSGGASAAAVARRLEDLRARITRACAAVGRQPSGVSILAVTKGFGPEAIDAALAAGLYDIGENYLQEAKAKFARTSWPPHPARRHFIGRIQQNKARRIAALFDVVQTVTDLDAASRLDESARACGKVLDVLVQVNVSGDQRSGVAPDEAGALGSAIASLAGLRLRGVMAVGPATSKPEAAFRRAAEVFEHLRGAGADTLSLGMSGDLEAAVAAGSTMLRIGTALFGDRPSNG